MFDLVTTPVSTANPTDRVRQQTEPLIGVALLTCASFFATWVSFWQFGGYDLSPLIDAFWRVQHGEHPGREFINTLPPLLLIAGKFSLDGWYGLILANIVVTLATYVGVIVITPSAERTSIWCAGVALIIAPPLLYTNHIWHSTISQLAGILFFYAVLRKHMHAIVICSALVILAKQNVAVPLLAVAFSFTVLMRRWEASLLIFGGAIAGVLLAWAALGLTPSDFLYTYTAVASRAQAIAEMIKIVTQFGINWPLWFLVLAAVGLFAVTFRPSPDAWFQAATLAAAFLPLMTDWDIKLNNAPLPLFVVATRLIHTERRQFVLGIAGAMTIIAALGGFARERMRGVGPFWEPVAQYRIADGYFAGMHVGGQLAHILAEMNALQCERCFFGPRIEFAYAATRRRSPIGLPLWWHPGTSYAPKDEDRIIEAFRANRFDTLVFVHNDRTRMPAQLLRVIDENYITRSSDAWLDILGRKANGVRRPVTK